MTDGSRPLTPPRALAYLRELSLDIRAALVLDATAAYLAGDAELQDRVAAAKEGSGTQVVRSGAETLVVARAANGVTIAVVAGPQVLVPLLVHDIEVVLLDLA